VKPYQSIIALVLVVGTCVAVGRTMSGRIPQIFAAGGGLSAQTPAAAFPKDVFADTGNRLPALKREDLDDAGKKLFDARGTGGAFGPGPIRLYSQPVAQHMADVNDFLRHKSGLDPRLVELVILITAREYDCEYVWTAHEPQGLKAGLQPEVIDVVKYHKSTDGLAEKDAVIITLGREVIGKHHVSSEVAARGIASYGKQGLVNIVALMGDYASTAILLDTFDQHVRPADKPLMPMP
jgi:4-carboxymuconolactone decarboxylase